MHLPKLRVPAAFQRTPGLYSFVKVCQGAIRLGFVLTAEGAASPLAFASPSEDGGAIAGSGSRSWWNWLSVMRYSADA